MNEQKPELDFSLPDLQVKGTGTLTDPVTGKVTPFWFGSPPDETDQPDDPTTKE